MRVHHIQKHKSNPMVANITIDKSCKALEATPSNLSLQYSSYSQALKVPMQQNLITLDLLSKGNDSGLHRTGSLEIKPTSNPADTQS